VEILIKIEHTDDGQLAVDTSYAGGTLQECEEYIVKLADDIRAKGANNVNS
jgi:hypothetical protein